MATFIAIDFEATGLLKLSEHPEDQPGIIEIGAIKDNGEEYQILIDPECEFEDKAQQITGINLEDLDGAPNLPVIFQTFAEFFVGATHLVTFNGTNYDCPLLMWNLRKYGLEYSFPWPPCHWDVMKISTDILGLQGKTGNKYPTLIECHTELFGEDYPRAHRAIDDAKATMRCFKKLRQDGYVT